MHLFGSVDFDQFPLRSIRFFIPLSRHSLQTSKPYFLEEAVDLRSAKLPFRMLLYQDILTDDEIASDAFPMYALKLTSPAILTNKFDVANLQKTRRRHRVRS